MTNNYVKIKGALGADPDFRKTKDGKDIAVLNVAVSDRYYDNATKEWTDTPVQWFRAVAFKGLQVSEARYLAKGSLVGIEGALKLSKYEDNKGVERTSVEISISSLEEIVRRKSENKEAA